MSHPTQDEILTVAAAQGACLSAWSTTKIAKFVGCVLVGILTKPLPEAVADCLKKF